MISVGYSRWMDRRTSRVAVDGVILEGPNGVLIEQSLRFAFKASNNQAEYEALIAGILLAKEMGARVLMAKSVMAFSCVLLESK